MQTVQSLDITTSIDSPDYENLYSFYAFLYLFFLGAFWIFYAFHSGLDLAPDEVYYWDWSRRLDWGYYEKPPLIAWAFALVTAIGGSTTFSIRAGNALIMIATMSGMFLLAKNIFNSRIGLWAIIAATLTPGMAAAAFIFTIDTPLMFFWAWSCLFIYLAVMRQAWVYWILGGIFLGGAYLSKQVSLAFPFLLVFCLFLFPAYRDRLRSPKIWVCFLISFAMLIPPLLWNYHHDWITFTHTAHHVEVNPSRIVQPHLFFEFLGSQAGLMGPILFLLMFAALWSRLKEGLTSLDFRNAYLLILGYPALLGFHFLSLFSRQHPNWAAAFYTTVYPFTVAWALQKDGKEYVKTKRRKQWLVIGICLGAVFTGLAYYPSILGALGFPLTPKTDPTLRLTGWSKLAGEVGKLAQNLEQQHQWKSGQYFFLSRDRDYVCELSFYLPGQPQVFLWSSNSEIGSQYQVWGGLEQRIGQNAIFINSDGSPLPPNLTNCFERVVHNPALEIEKTAGVVKKYGVYLCYNLKQLSLSYPAFPR